jgi:hypothetical protein
MTFFEFIKLSTLVLTVSLVACGGGGADVSEENNAKAPDLQSLTFQVSDYSSHIEFSQNSQFIRLKLSFFPDNSQFDFNQNKITLPCSIGGLPEGVDVNLNAPVDPEICESPLVVAVVHDGESMGVDGIVVRSDRNLFEEELGIEISPQGVKNLANEMMILAPTGKLAEYYSLANRELNLN